MSLAGTVAFGTACLAMTSFFNYSPYMAKRSAPASQWVDAPIPLVATPQHLTGKMRNKLSLGILRNLILTCWPLD